MPESPRLPPFGAREAPREDRQDETGGERPPGRVRHVVDPGHTLAAGGRLLRLGSHQVECVPKNASVFSGLSVVCAERERNPEFGNQSVESEVEVKLRIALGLSKDPRIGGFGPDD